MTLYRQLILFTFILFLVLFSGTWFAKLQTTRSFLVNQLQSHAQDTATSLALSVSQFASENDMIVVEGMISAVFDRGYYEIITYTDNNGKVLIKRILKVKIENVPQWFIHWFPLETPEVTANVMAGWSHAGKIYVKSHPGYAYKTLWNDVVSVTIWFLCCGIFVLIVGGFGLRILLKPLVLVERQADALCRKEYILQERIPRTKELKSVVEAMNRMTTKVKEMFEEQVVHAEGLRERAYHDPLTNLGNRRYLESQITARLDRLDSVTKGVFLLVQIHDLQELNQQRGFQAGDELLKSVAELMQESTQQFANCVLARLTGGDFAIFLPDALPWDAESVASDLKNKFGQLAIGQIALTDNVAHIGAATYDGSTKLSRLLSEADIALSAAKQTGPNEWNIRSITEETDKMPLGQQQWKDTLEQALQERRISLDAQPVVKTTDKDQILQLEVFSRIVQLDGKFLSAGLFMPIAERLKIVSSLDRLVIEEVLLLDRNKLGVNNIAVNVSPASLQDDTFLEWIYATLKKLPPEVPQITFEFFEFGAVQHLDLVKKFSSFVHEYGHKIGLDHYGQSFSNLRYLEPLHPDYVKIDRAYTRELKSEENDSKFFIGSLCSVAHSIDISVIAEGVETEQQWQILKELNIDAIQGYVVAKPKPIKDMINK
ncbi:MAG: EAL domain-containing protein [Pseudomonadota bacterium]